MQTRWDGEVKQMSKRTKSDTGEKLNFTTQRFSKKLLSLRFTAQTRVEYHNTASFEKDEGVTDWPRSWDATAANLTVVSLVVFKSASRKANKKIYLCSNHLRNVKKILFVQPETNAPQSHWTPFAETVILSWSFSSVSCQSSCWIILVFPPLLLSNFLPRSWSYPHTIT